MWNDCQCHAGCREQRLPHTNQHPDCEGVLLGLAARAVLDLPGAPAYALALGGRGGWVGREKEDRKPLLAMPLLIQAKGQAKEKRFLVLMFPPGGVKETSRAQPDFVGDDKTS